MNANEILDNLITINEVYTIGNIEGYISPTSSLTYNKIDDLIIHRIELLNKSYDESVINTGIYLLGSSIGDIFYLKNRTLEISLLSQSQYYAFLSEAEVADLLKSHYTFKNNYLLIHKDYIDDFHLKYSSNSAIWGGFKLVENVSVINYYKKAVTFIEIPYELNLLDNYAKDAIYRALEHKSAFERFLKMYHLLELEFDYSLIKKIQNLNIITDSNKIGNLLNEYNRSEIDRLIDLISNKCSDINSLADKLNLIKPYQGLGEEIFIKFGKAKGNFYLSDLLKYNDLLSDNDAFTSSDSVKDFAKIPIDDYNKFIHYITAYWIYRIRCSIAHFKIGEYILTRDKEDFIVEFAEPLIQEVLMQFYKK